MQRACTNSAWQQGELAMRILQNDARLFVSISCIVSGEGNRGYHPEI